MTDRPCGLADANHIWTDDILVLLTSFWDWSPETWGTVGWSNDSHRTNLMKKLSDPFICVCYVTSSSKIKTDPDMRSMIADFYLVSHEMGDRNDFTHPINHDREPAKWRHSLRAIRAFSYLPEYSRKAKDVFPELSRTARNVSAMGVIISDRAKIDDLRRIPWLEVPVYAAGEASEQLVQPEFTDIGMVPAGPTSDSGYIVPEGTKNLPRELYVLRLTGDISAYLGRSVEDKTIIKIGLSVSPDLRRQNLQKAMPRGAFRWQVMKRTRNDEMSPYSGFSVAVAGENAMKQYLAQHSEWLGGEFYLTTDDQIEIAWKLGRAAALDVEKESLVHDNQ